MPRVSIALITSINPRSVMVFSVRLRHSFEELLWLYSCPTLQLRRQTKEGISSLLCFIGVAVGGKALIKCRL